MEWCSSRSRALVSYGGGVPDLESLFNSRRVQGALAFFWLLGTVMLLVGVMANMKLTYVPIHENGNPPKIMGLTKYEAFVLISIAVTVHMVLLFIFTAMVLNERAYRRGDQQDRRPDQGMNAPGLQRAVDDSAISKEKKEDLPPCYDCLMCDDTPPPPFHSLILAAAHSSTSLSSQCQETWPCLSSEYNTPEADKPNFEYIEVAGRGNTDFERTNLEQSDEDGANDDFKQNHNKISVAGDEIDDTIQSDEESNEIIDLDPDDPARQNVEYSEVISNEISNEDSSQLEQCIVALANDAGRPICNQFALGKNVNAEVNETYRVTTDLVMPDLKQIDEIADSLCPLAEHYRSDCSFIHPESPDYPNIACLVQQHSPRIRNSNTAVLKLDYSRSTESITNYVEESSLQNDTINFPYISDGGSVTKEVFDQSTTMQSMDDRQFNPEVCDASYRIETEKDSDGGESTLSIKASKSDLFNSPMDEQCFHSKDFGEIHTEDNRFYPKPNGILLRECTVYPFTDRVPMYPTFYYSQINFNSGESSYNVDLKESRESGIQSCTSLADSNELELFDDTSDRFDRDLDSAIGSYVSIAMQNHVLQNDDNNATSEMI